MDHRREASSYDPGPSKIVPLGLHCSHVDVRVDAPSGVQTVLSDISCSFTEPRTAVIGLNGSGKSTLLRLYNALAVPSTGDVRVGTINPTTATREARNMVGFVFTDPAAQILMPTPLEDIELSLRSRIKDRHSRRERAAQWLEGLGLENKAHHSVFDLSGGERQLVALAAVLATEPKVLILDEPTTLLDLRNEIKLVERLDHLPQQQLISTHNLDLAATAHQVAVLHQGRMIAQGLPGEIIPQYENWCAHGFPDGGRV